MLKTKAFAASRFAFDFFAPNEDQVATGMNRDWAARLAYVTLVIYGLAVLTEVANQFSIG